MPQPPAKRRRRSKRRPPPRLSLPEILAWADAYHRRHKAWPRRNSGRVAGQGDETWQRINMALQLGIRGLPGGSTLARELLRHRGVDHSWIRLGPPLTIAKILAWADAHRRETGRWPQNSSGRVAAAPGETWAKLNLALVKGRRGLPGGTTLAQELRRRGRRNVIYHNDPLTADQIFRWAKSHFRRTGRWPQASDGAILGAVATTWGSINNALARGCRGLPDGSSLKEFLVDRHAVGPERRRWRSVLTLEQIWEWAQAFHRKHDAWPRTSSGPIPGTNGDTWSKISAALEVGVRGLPGGTTLLKFLQSMGADARRKFRNRLEPRQILVWADAYFEEHQAWPYWNSGPIPDSDGETWSKINVALRYGVRGLPGRSSLSRFLIEHRKVEVVNSHRPHRSSKPKLAVDQIRTWAAAHKSRTGQWPHLGAGSVPGAPDFTWQQIDSALRHGSLGLPGGSSLARLFGRKQHQRRRRTPSKKKP